jgi:hypothetical protein
MARCATSLTGVTVSNVLPDVAPHTKPGVFSGEEFEGLCLPAMAGTWDVMVLLEEVKP